MSNFEELKRLETAYVVKLHNFVQLAEEKACFTFHHPNPDIGGETHNKRQIEIDFDVEQARRKDKKSHGRGLAYFTSWSGRQLKDSY